MKKRFTFVARTQLMREPDGSHFYKAGFFYSNATGLLSPIKRRPAFTERLRNASARASGCVRSGIWQVAFLSAYTRTQSNYAYQHTVHSCRVSIPATPTDRGRVNGSTESPSAFGKRPNQAVLCRLSSIYGHFKQATRCAVKSQCTEGRAPRTFQVTSKHFFTSLSHLCNQERV